MTKTAKDKKPAEKPKQKSRYEVARTMRKMAAPGNNAQLTRLLAMQKPKVEKKTPAATK